MLYRREDIPKPLTVTILGDERTFGLLQALLQQASSRQVVAEGTPQSPGELLRVVLSAAPPPGGLWILVIDFSIWDNLTQSEVEAIAAYRMVRAWIEALDIIKDYQLEIDLKDCLPTRIVPIHIGRDATEDIYSRIEQAIHSIV